MDISPEELEKALTVIGAGAGAGFVLADGKWAPAVSFSLLVMQKEGPRAHAYRMPLEGAKRLAANLQQAIAQAEAQIVPPGTKQ